MLKLALRYLTLLKLHAVKISAGFAACGRWEQPAQCFPTGPNVWGGTQFGVNPGEMGYEELPLYLWSGKCP